MEPGFWKAKLLKFYIVKMEKQAAADEIQVRFLIDHNAANFIFNGKKFYAKIYILSLNLTSIVSAFWL